MTVNLAVQLSTRTFLTMIFCSYTLQQCLIQPVTITVFIFDTTNFIRELGWHIH